MDRIAVDTCATPFLEQVFPNFVPGKGSLLVLDARDLRCLDQFGVEADKFLGDGSRRSQGPELVHEAKAWNRRDAGSKVAASLFLGGGR